MESLEQLKTAAANWLKKQPDSPYVSNGDKSFTTHSLAKEIEDGTPDGIETLNGLVILAMDLLLRKKKFNNLIPEIKWRKLHNSDKYMFGDVSGLTLFYIKDRNIGGGLDKFELEVKFLDQRWTSNTEDELKSIANEQLHTLVQKLTGSGDHKD